MLYYRKCFITARAVFSAKASASTGLSIFPSCLIRLFHFSFFAGLQGGPHNHTITALATALKQAKAPEYVEYQKQVGIYLSRWGMKGACKAVGLKSTFKVVNRAGGIMSTFF